MKVLLGLLFFVLVVFADDYGNSIATATTVNIPSTTQGNIETAGDVDFFKIVVTRVGRLLVKSTGTTDTFGILLDSRGTLVESDDDDGISHNFLIGRLVAAGVYYIKVKNYYQRGTGSYALIVRFDTGNSDDHGNTIATATPIATNSTTAGNIEVAGDVDFFKITIPSAGNLIVNTTGSTDTFGYLLGANGAEVARSDDAGGTLQRNFQISRSVQPGIYYVKVRHYGASSTGRYSLVSHFVASNSDDDYGNTRSTAHILRGTTGVLSAHLESSGDVDMFKITLPRSGRLVFNTRGDLDTFGYLLDANGTELVHADDAGGTLVRNFQISKNLNAGVYYIKVRGYSQAIRGVYVLAYNFTSGDNNTSTGDDHGNTMATATTVLQNSTTAGNIETAGDIDFFKIVIPRTLIVVINTTGSMDTFGYLLDSSGNRIAISDDAGGELARNFRISKILQPGTYYIKVKCYSPQRTGSYSLVVNSLDATTDRHGNTPQTATTIEPDSTTPGILTSSDIDFFKVTIPKRGTLTLRTVSSINTIGFLMRNSSGSIIASNDNGGNANNFRIRQELNGGTYYLKVISMRSNGEYTLLSSITYPHDDYSDTISGATLIGANSTTNGNFEVANDTDVFKISLPTSGILELNATKTGTTGSLINASNVTFAISRVSEKFGIKRFVQAGIYYVKINSLRRTGSYTLTSSFTSVTQDDYPNTIVRPHQINLNSTTSGILETTEDIDMFKIVLPSRGHLILSPLYSVSGAIFQIFDSAGGGVGSLYPRPIIGYDRISQNFDAGTYYIRVRCSNRTTSTGTGIYSFRTSFSSIDHGSGISTSTVVEPVSTTSGILSGEYDHDYFKVTIPSSGALVVYTVGTSFTTGELLDANGYTISTTNSRVFGANFMLIKTVASGNYYIKVGGGFGSTSSNQYKLIVHFTQNW